MERPSGKRQMNAIKPFRNGHLRGGIMSGMLAAGVMTAAAWGCGSDSQPGPQQKSEGSPPAVAQPRAAQADSQQALPSFPAPAYTGAGLMQTDKGFFVGANRLPLEPSPPMQAHAAYYQQEGLLVTVSTSADVTLYQTEGGRLIERKRIAGEAHARTSAVHFSRVPGLLYVLWIDTTKEAELRGSCRQEYPDRYSRYAMTDVAGKYDAMPDDQGNHELLNGCYLLTNKKVVPFSLKEGNWGKLELAESLGEPFRSGPGDSLAQCVFVFPTHGIVCRTHDGWSVNDCNGKLVKHFNSGGIKAMWWTDPEFKQGSFLVCTRSGPNGKTFRLDLAKGKLIETPY
jgi:hypothetical protein